MAGIDQILTWTLIHSLWIAMLIWLLVNIISAFLTKSKVRRLVKIGGFLSFTAGIIVVLSNQIPILPDTSGFAVFGNELAYFKPTFSRLDQLKIWISTNSQIISVIWLLGSVIGAIRFLSNSNSLAKCRTTAIQSGNESATEMLNQIRDRLKMNRRVKLMISSVIDSPMTIGIIKPVIYFPAGLISGFSTSELETILLHELVHIKRHDYLVNLFLVILETIFFFNPIILIMVKDLRREMEYVCDDEVLESHNQITYSKALIKLQEITISKQVALAAKNNNSEFKNRIERMINPNNKTANPQIGLVVLVIISLLVSTAYTNIRSESPTPAPAMEYQEVARQDTVKLKNKKELEALIKQVGFDSVRNMIITMSGTQVSFLDPVKFKKVQDNIENMIKEVQSELQKDGILNEDRQKVTLMFQYSDVLNGEKTLGDKYEKYKGILNKYFPKYDSFASTRVFRFKKT